VTLVIVDRPTDPPGGRRRWEDDARKTPPETFQNVHARITQVLAEQCAQAGRALIVTSGGVIGLAMRHALGLDTTGMARVMLQINNASLHRLSYVRGTLQVAGFNSTPHLDTPDRAHARTYV